MKTTPELVKDIAADWADLLRHLDRLCDQMNALSRSVDVSQAERMADLAEAVDLTFDGLRQGYEALEALRDECGPSCGGLPAFFN